MKKINWWSPNFSEVEVNGLKKVLNSNYLNEGKETKKFETKISKLLNVKYCVCTTSGTIAIYLALKALGISKHDEVLIPNFTFIATANAVKLCNAKPIFIDIDKKTLCIDTNKIICKINSKTKAIIPVHISGRSANMREILKISRKYNLKIVEDAAEAFFSKYNKNSFLGTLGDIGCFSLSPNKIISTGQGGFITTNNRIFYEKIKRLKDQGRLNRGTGGNDIHNHEGYNFKFNDLLASVGLSQINKINIRKKKQIETYNFYKDNLKTKYVNLLSFKPDNCELPLWCDAIYNSNKSKLFFNYLKKMKIPVRNFWLPINKQKIYKNFTILENTSYISKNGFWLPSSMDLSKSQLSYICKKINDYTE